VQFICRVSRKRPTDIFLLAEKTPPDGGTY
jgi:hypothetical protein